MSDDRTLVFDDGWIEPTPYLLRLNEQGYGVGGWVNPTTKKNEFWLTGKDGLIFETDELEQLNNFLKLLTEKEQ